MNNPPEHLLWPQRLLAFSWDTPWAWPLSQQVGALTALVLVLLMACVASLSPWWESLHALQQSHQSLSAQYEAGQQKLRDLPDLEQRVQSLRDAHERRQRDSAVAPAPWMHPVNWTPVPGLMGASAAPRWRGQTQGQSSEMALVLAQIATTDAALQMELTRTAQAGQWRLTWEVSGAEPPLGSRIEPGNPSKWFPMLDDEPMRAHWRAQLLAQPGRVQWLLPQLSRPAEALEAFELGQLAWIGWLEQGDRRVALVQAGNGVQRVAVGGYMGRQHGRVEHIGADHLVLREVMRNPQGVWGPVLTRWPALAPAVPKGSAPSSEAKAPP
jgi:Tfp pilus assembly protein PilP